MVFATSRNNLRTASDVKRGAGSGLVPLGTSGTGAGRVAHLLCQLAEFGFGDCQFERVQLLVQEAHLLAIAEPERLQPGSGRVDLGGARAQQRLELDESGTQVLQMVVVTFGADERGHVENDSE